MMGLMMRRSLWTPIRGNAWMQHMLSLPQEYDLREVKI